MNFPTGEIPGGGFFTDGFGNMWISMVPTTPGMCPTGWTLSPLFGFCAFPLDNNSTYSNISISDNIVCLDAICR